MPERTTKPQEDAKSQNIEDERSLKKKRGRPKGSKNKKTLEREAELRAQGIDPEAPTPKRGRGRPKGSKNKKTLEREAESLAQSAESLFLNDVGGGVDPTLLDPAIA